jgi:hypothetical protein
MIDYNGDEIKFFTCSKPVLKLAEVYNMHINYLKYRASIQTQNSSEHVSIDKEDKRMLKTEIKVICKI